MDFIQDQHDDILVEVVNLTRATLKEAEEFKLSSLMISLMVAEDNCRPFRM